MSFLGDSHFLTESSSWDENDSVRYVYPWIVEDELWELRTHSPVTSPFDRWSEAPITLEGMLVQGLPDLGFSSHETLQDCCLFACCDRLRRGGSGRTDPAFGPVVRQWHGWAIHRLKEAASKKSRPS